LGLAAQQSSAPRGIVGSLPPGRSSGACIGAKFAARTPLPQRQAKYREATSGSARVNGRITSPIEVGAGVVPDFTGRENVYINATILGMSRQELDKKFNEIIDFSEMIAHLTPCQNVPHKVH